jgi:hypothetical protein
VNAYTALPATAGYAAKHTTDTVEEVSMKYRVITAAIALALVSGAATAQHSNVAINGQVLSQQQLAALEMQLGTRIAPGSYMVDYRSGCWANLSTGQQGCGTGGGGNGTYTSRYGSGEWNANGDWSHYSNIAGGGVGGSGDGCVYAFGWSNC